MDSLSLIEHALSKLGVKPQTLIVPLFVVVGEVDELFAISQLKAWAEAGLV